MMSAGVRTISQVAGDAGLTRNATADPFAKSEESILKLINRELTESRSQEAELQSARGFSGGNTFLDAANKRKEEGILSNVFSQFTQARTTEDLRERDFGRTISSQLLGAELEEDSAVSGFKRQTDLVNLQADIEERLSSGKADLNQEFLSSQLEGQKARDVLGFEFGETSAQNTLTRQKSLLSEGARIRSEEVEQEFGLNNQVIQTNFNNRLLELDTNFNNQQQILDRQSQNALANLTEEVRLKKEAEISVLQSKLDLERQNAIDAVFNNLLGSLTLQLVNSVTSVIPGLNNLTQGLLGGDDVAGAVGDLAGDLF